ncbi:MAG: hypothetical protein NTX30_03975, partial [Deltaproteobacteria bacterium]|nr:hypothetical protein [Deltaproteobacteria bacterium]
GGQMIARTREPPLAFSLWTPSLAPPSLPASLSVNQMKVKVLEAFSGKGYLQSGQVSSLPFEKTILFMLWSGSFKSGSIQILTERLS